MIYKIVSVILTVILCFIALFSFFITPYQKQIDSLKQDVTRLEQKIEEMNADMVGTLQPDGNIFWEDK